VTQLFFNTVGEALYCKEFLENIARLQVKGLLPKVDNITDKQVPKFGDKNNVYVSMADSLSKSDIQNDVSNQPKQQYVSTRNNPLSAMIGPMIPQKKVPLISKSPNKNLSHEELVLKASKAEIEI
jgi:hypothetical protein